MAQAQANGPVIRDASADETNPTAGTVMADTGELDGGLYDVTIFLSSSALAKFSLQVRNAANDANVGAVHVFYCAVGVSVSQTIRVQINHNERIRIVMHTSLTGTAAVSLVAQRVA